jgi:redox-sensitive bicupin YhaK (pirin superfamily)
MKSVVHKSAERGYANHGWLKSHHSFSFAGYYNPEKIQFGALRVLNDDTVAPGYGFGNHPHDNMEIVSIPLKGDLHHQDSTGRDRIIRQGDVQIMSAGTGITHSEKNASKIEEVHFLQIWVLPKLRNIEPRYDQKSFLQEGRNNCWQTVVAPYDPQAIRINQDAWFTLGHFETGYSANYKIHKTDNGIYVFIINGQAELDGTILEARDAMAIREADNIQLKTLSSSKILVIEVPLNSKTF